MSVELKEFTVYVSDATSAEKYVKISGTTGRNPNAGKKDGDGNWIKTPPKDWVKSWWNIYIYDPEAKKIQKGDKITISEGAKMTHEVWEHDGKKDYPLKTFVKKGEWKWSSRAEKKEPVAEEEPDF